MTATNKQYSYLRVAAIQIDVHPAGETRPTHHTHPMLIPRMIPNHTYLTWSTHSNLSRSHQQSWIGPLLPRKRAPDTIQSTPADWSTGSYPVFLQSQPMKQWGQNQLSVDGRLLGLSDPYHRHAIGTFNTCSRGPTYRSLIDTRGGYNLEGISFPNTTPWPSQPMVSRFHLRAPLGLQVSYLSNSGFQVWAKQTYSRHMVFRPLGHLPSPTSIPSHS
jgi:hypothetical protein